MKFKPLICIFLCVLLLVAPIYTQVRAEQSEEAQVSVSNGSHTLDATQCLLGNSKLVSNTETAILYETKTQTLLYAYNADVRMYPSSFVKLMTLLIALEEGDLAQEITVKQDVLNSVSADAMSVNLSAGEVLTLEDLLYCMIVGSGNDAAAVIGDAIAGSQEAFVEKMNAYAQEFGCTNTNFMNVHGLHHEQQYITARDAARIMEQGLKNDTFRKIIGTDTYLVCANEIAGERNLVTNNYLISTHVMDIYKDNRVKGGRTGVDNYGRRCVAAVANSGNMELISIVMGTKSTYEADGYTVRVYGGFPETTDLLTQGFQGVRGVEIFHKDQVMRQYGIMGGNCDLFSGALEGASTVLPYSVGLEDLTFVYKDSFNGAYPAIPVNRGDFISTVQVWYRDICVGSSVLYAMNTVDGKQPEFVPSMQSDTAMPWWGWVLIVFGSLVVLAGIYILVMRYVPFIRKLLYEKQRRNRW